MVGIDDVAALFGDSPVTDRASSKSTRVFFSGYFIPHPQMNGIRNWSAEVPTLRDRETWTEASVDV